jgi:hypothetical protein
MKWVELDSKEKRIDFRLANLEQATLVEEILKRGGGNEWKAALEKASSLKDRKTSQYAYFQKTLDMARKYGIETHAYENFSRYVDYLSGFTAIDADAALGEMIRAEDALFARLLGNEDARTLRGIDRYLGLLKTAYKIQLTTSDFGLYDANRPDFESTAQLSFLNRKLAEYGYAGDLFAVESPIGENEAPLKAFYDSVRRRDHAFLANAEKAMAKHDQKVAVLITGGYHTQHLKKLFVEKGYSVAVLTPNVTSETNQAKYEKRLLSGIVEETKEIKTV